MDTGRTPTGIRSAIGGLLLAAGGLALIAPGLAPGSAAARPAHAIPRARHARASACANAGTPSVNAGPKAMRTAVACLINRQRLAHGLPRLRVSWRLNESAQGWTNWMVGHRQFTHGTNFSARISAVGFDWQDAGENIATGYLTPQAVVRGWMASAGHCQNILNPTYRYVGTGVSRHGVPGFGSGPSTWTQDFALPMNQSAPSGNWGPAQGCPYG